MGCKRCQKLTMVISENGLCLRCEKWNDELVYWTDIFTSRRREEHENN